MQLQETWTSHLIPTFEKVGEGGDTQSKRRKLAFLGVQICTFFFTCFSFVRMHGASTYVRVYPMSHAFTCPIPIHPMYSVTRICLVHIRAGQRKTTHQSVAREAWGFGKGKRAVVGPVSGHDP